MTSERSPCFDSEGNIWVKVGHSSVPKSFVRAMTLVTDLELCTGGATWPTSGLTCGRKCPQKLSTLSSQYDPRELDGKDVLHLFKD